MSEVLRVTHVLYLGEPPGQNPISGAEKHVLSLLPALAQAGVDVELIAILWGGTSYETVRRELRELQAQGVGVVTVRGSSESRSAGHSFRFLRAWAMLSGLLSVRRERIVHLHLDIVFAPLVARLSGCRKVVLSVHCDEPRYARPPWRFWLRFLDRMVTHYIAITRHVRDYYLAAAGLAPSRISTVYYGIDRPNTTADRSVLGLPTSAFVVGYVGRLADQKNLGTLIEALARRPDVVGVLIGDGPMRVSLEHAARGLANVRFVGAVPNASTQMGLFDLLCLPSSFEGLGLVLVEAMLAGIPVAGSRRGAIPEVLGNGRYGLLFEPTVDGLTAAIDFARSHAEQLRSQANLACQYASDMFSVRRMVAGTRQVYELVEAMRS